MFARVLTFQFQANPELEAQMQKLEQEFMPVLREQKGFVKLYELLDRVNGNGLQIHFWETEADLLAYLNGPVAKDRQSYIQTLVKDQVTTPPKGEHYEVVGQS